MQRIESKNDESYVSKLTSKGINKIAQKVGEEGVEVTIAAINESNDLLLEEVADLLFHTIIALQFRDLSIFNAIDVLKARERK